MKSRNAKSRVLSTRVPQRKYEELRKFFKKEKDGEILQALIDEKLARERFDQWINSMSKHYRDDDIDLESLS